MRHCSTLVHVSELLPEPLHPSRLRASNADRERVAAVLREAAAEGRLDLHELDERLARLYAARTYAELEPLTYDLPAVGAPPVPVPMVASHDGLAPVSTGGVAVMSRFERTGRWSVGREFGCVAFWGGGLVDLRDAVFVAGGVHIRAIAIMGGIEIWVPEDATVHVTGLGIMGGFDHAAAGAGAPGAPTVTIGGLAFWGGVSIERRPSDREARLRKLEKKRRKLESRSSFDE